jgi:hypothetical protein
MALLPIIKNLIAIKDTLIDIIGYYCVVLLLAIIATQYYCDTIIANNHLESCPPGQDRAKRYIRV